MAKVKKIDLASADIIQQKKNDLKRTFPEVFAEGKIDFDKLRLALGEIVEIGRERYGMNWPGKISAIKVAQEPSVAALKPDREVSVDFDNTKNLFIEGDNLEVLKLLQKSYFGKVKMIYIDPPYNTGNEFIYPDKYAENLETYLQYTGQIDAQGKKFSSNTEADGRYHSKWMNMMWPRLFLARNLMCDDGVIFISIDDHESDNLKKICNEVFGEENFVAQIVWEKRFTRSNNSRLFATLTENVLLYRKSDLVDELKEPRNEKADSIYSNPDNDPRDVWTSVSYVNPATKEQRPNLAYPITNPLTGKMIEHPTNAWKYEKDTYEKHVKENRLYWGVNGENTYPRLKKFLSEMDGNMVPVDLWNHEETGTTDEGSKILEKILGAKVFDFPKPPRLIQRMLRIGTRFDKNDIILDFFTGSGTTAQAILEQNVSDNGNRKFICIQLPEPCDKNTEAYKAGYKNICDIGEERIRRVIKKIKLEESQKLDLEKKKIDLGFKVFKLGKSNFSVWEGNTKEDLEQQLQLSIENIAKSSTPESILYELLLKAGYGLEEAVEKKKIDGKTAYFVSGGKLSICLEKEIKQNLMKAIADQKPEMVICLNSSFATDADLTNAAQIMKSKQIEFRTV